MSLEIRPIGTANLPDAARLCLAGHSLADRPPAFTHDVELESTRCKLSRLRGAMSRGAVALAAYRSGMLVGYAEAHPVEQCPAPVVGDGFDVLACVRVPEAAERDEVESALTDALAAARPASRGLAVVAREKDWGPRGFAAVAREASEVETIDRVLWWRPRDGAAAGGAPRFAPVDRQIPAIAGRVRVDVFASDRCPWDRYVLDLVRRVCASRREHVVLFETDCTKRREVVRTGVAVGVAVNGRFQPWFRPHRLPDEHAVRRALDRAG